MTARDVGAARRSQSAAELRVAVDSIGHAGIGLVAGLAELTGVPAELIARLLYQAPSILASDLSAAEADRVLKLLRSAGVEGHILKPGELFEPGRPENEVALVVRRFDRIAAVLNEVIALLGVPLQHAQRIVRSAPAVLMGQVSSSCVEAIRQRLEPLGVEVDVSRPHHARFDLYVGACSAGDRHRIAEILTRSGVAELDPNGSGAELAAADLSRQQADSVWDGFAGTSLPVRLLNRDFQRFDVCLEAAPDTPELRHHLAQAAGMPERVVPKVLASLPVVTHSNLRIGPMFEALGAFEELGAKARSDLLAFRSFDLELEAVEDLERARQILQAVGEMSEQEARRAVEKRGRLATPLTHTHARWLQHALGLAGTRCRLAKM